MNENFYDDLSPYYRLFFADWETSVLRQAAILDGIIREFFDKPVRSILDAACGIGTQCIGLSQYGYELTASDISTAELALAQAEAQKKSLPIQFKIADFRNLWNVHQRQFDLVIACDNAIPHVLSDADIFLTFEQFYRCLIPGGGCIISVRDYDHMEKGGVRINPRLVHEDDGRRTILFDVWKFDGDYYDMTTYIVEDRGEKQVESMAIRGGRYYCISVNGLAEIFRQTGFVQVRIINDRFYQPMIIARKPIRN